MVIGFGDTEAEGGTKLREGKRCDGAADTAGSSSGGGGNGTGESW